MKKLFSFFLALVASVGMLHAQNGTCGDNLTWNLSNGVLTISGSGNMSDYIPGDAPWYNSRTTIVQIVIENGVTSIGNYAFYRCSSLTSITIPNSVTSIGTNVFAECSSIISPVYNVHVFAYMPTSYSGAYAIPSGIESIAYSAFSGCSGLTSITIPNSVTSIGGYTFHNCSSLTSVNIPNSVTSFGRDVFNYCSSLTSIIAPAVVFDIPEYAWQYSPKHLENVCVNAGELTEDAFGFIARSYKTLKSLDLSATTHTELADEAFKDFYNLQSLNLPANLTHINYMAVAGCKNLLSIDIPASVKEIEQSAFEDCRSIETITFGGVQPSPVIGHSLVPAAASQLRKIGNWAFYNAHELQHLEIPEGVEEIGDGAFYGCTYLEELSLPASVRKIGDNCFALCSKLTKITVNSTTPPTIEAKTFFDVKRQIPVYVPDEYVGTYKNDQYWGEFDIQGVSNMQSAVETVSADATRTTKLLLDGQLLILRDGKTYTVQGVEVK